MNPLQKRLMRAITGSPGDPNLDDLLARSDDLLAAAAPDPVHPSRDSRPRHTFSGGNPIEHMSARQIVRYLPRGVSEVASFLASMRAIRRFRPRIPRSDPAGLSEAIANELRRLGAVEWGFAKIPSRAVFAGKAVPYPYAIVFSGPMDPAILAKAPDFEVLREVAGAYGRVGKIANRLSRFIRDRGWNALPGHPLGGVVSYPILGQEAGLGWIGRSGMLISPVRGPSQRVGVVYTDLSGLAFGSRPDHSWVSRFCASCGICSRKCPVGAIDPGGSTSEPARFEPVDGDLCLPYFHAHWGCSVCVGFCPFTRTSYDTLKTSWERRNLRPGGE